LKNKPIEKYFNTFSVTSIYAVTLFVIWLGISPFVMKQVFSLPSQSESQMYMPLVARNRAKLNEVQIISGKPAKISIPSLGIQKDVIDGFYNSSTKSWNVYKYGVHYALPTYLANNKEGNTLLYGHNNEYVFGSLKDITPGSKVEITTQNNHVFTYVFSAKQALFKVARENNWMVVVERKDMVYGMVKEGENYVLKQVNA
jgi:hypothetical protein